MNAPSKPPVFQSASEPSSGEVSQEDRTMAMLCHLSALLGYVIPIPFANVLCPLIIWMVKKDDSPYLEEQGREAVNFQITICLALLVSAVLCFVLIGIPMVIGVIIFQVVYCIIAALEAKAGKPYRYPYSFRFF